jgi:hypothetical protein
MKNPAALGALTGFLDTATLSPRRPTLEATSWFDRPYEEGTPLSDLPVLATAGWATRCTKHIPHPTKPSRWTGHPVT